MGDASDDVSKKAFVDALFGEDDLGVVVRAHIHVEAKLVEFLELLVVAPQHLERMKLEFEQKVNLAVALGLKPEHASGLSALGNLRNAFAHRLDAKLSEERVRNLYETLSGADKQARQVTYDKTNRDAGKSDAPPLKELSPRDRFILINRTRFPWTPSGLR
jgi:hypothetical protein